MTSDAGPRFGEPRRLHPAAFLFRVARIARQFALPILVALFAGGDRTQLFVAGPLLAGLAISIVGWWRYTYTFDGRAFAIDEGIVNRRHRTVPVDRIQQIDVEEKLGHRLLGVVALRIDTGSGSSGAEVNLAAVSKPEAERLRRALLGRDRAAAPAAASPAPVEHAHRDEYEHGDENERGDEHGHGDEHEHGREHEEPIVRLGPGILALGGITGPEQLVMVGILVSLAQVADDVPASWFERLDQPAVVPTGPLAVAVALAALAGVWIALAAAAAVVKYYGFALVCRDDAIHISRGLLDKREASLALRRMQAVAIQQTFLRRAFGVLSLRITSGGTPSSGNSGVSRLLVPVLRAAEVERVLGRVHPTAVPLPPLVPAPLAALRRAVVRWVVPAALVALAVTLLFWPLGALAVAAVPAAVLLGYAHYRGLAHGASATVLVARHGALQRQTVVADKAKVQTCVIESTPLQRRAGLADLRVTFAGNESATIHDADARLLEALFADIATARRARRDEASVRREVVERR